MKNKILVIGAMAAMVIGGPVLAADGKALFDKSCGACHKAMKPKLGDKAAWAPLIKQGPDALVASAIKGKGAMPPRGGTKLSDDDIKAVVEYMISQSQ